MSRSARWLFACVAAAVPLRAQDPATPAQPMPAPTAPRTAQDPLASALLLDRVVATVNDAVVLQREILAATVPQIDSAERARGGPLSPGERRQVFVRTLTSKIDQHTLAQAAVTLGILPPERVESYFQERLQEEERELVRKLGTLQAVTEEQARQGRNWEAFVREERVDKLSALTSAMAVQTRLNNQSNLFITPRMMRTFYRENLGEFVRDARAVLGIVTFVGADANAAATAAAEIWRTEELSPEELAKRFEARGALAPQAVLIDDAARKERRRDQVEFALKGPAGTVSLPMADEVGVRLWKVLDHAASRKDSFEDPEVQKQIREHLEQRTRDRLLDQTLKRAKERTQVWQPEDLRSKPGR